MRHSELKAKNPDPDLSCPRRRASPFIALYKVTELAEVTK